MIPLPPLTNDIAPTAVWLEPSTVPEIDVHATDWQVPGTSAGVTAPAVTRRPCKAIIGRSAALRAVLKQVATVAPTNATVLIQGETGTGKELVARAVHNLSSRADREMIKINCASIPAGLIESELFGHEKGAFTGAIARKLGRFELAHHSTVFLDEVGDIPPELQPKLLRVLQEREFERLGSTQVQRANVRVVAATSRDLSLMVAERQFRSDLYYRLNVFPIRVPPLRDRLEDIPLLVRHFVDKYAQQFNRQIETIPLHVMDQLRHYPWPGNIRELQNFIERAVIMSPSTVLEPPMMDLEQSTHRGSGPGSAAPFHATTLEECEREHILKALSKTRWVVGGPNGAALMLDVKRTTLIGKMQKLGIAHQRNQGH